MKRFLVKFGVAAWLSLCLVWADDSAVQEASVFSLPAKSSVYQQLQRDIGVALRKAENTQAVELLRKSIALSPLDPIDRYRLGCVLAKTGEQEEALLQLKKSVEFGMRSASLLNKNKDLDSLRGTDGFEAIMALVAKPPPTSFDRFANSTTAFRVKDGKANLEASNCAWDFRSGTFYSLFDFGEADHSIPIVTGDAPVRNLLRSWYAEGQAAGLHGVLYDNRDQKHSTLKLKQFPQMVELVYSSEAIERGLDMGLQESILHQAVVLGNSSTALSSGLYWRSQARLAYVKPGSANRLARQYRANHLYLYPEHRDHDPGRNGAKKGGYGDVFPANTPYILVAQGSSWSDQPFLKALALTLAAFQPDTKEKLKASGGLMPALQMITRISNPMLIEPGDYLTGKAHPTVFAANQLDPLAMVKKANAIEPDQLPPRVEIKVLREEASAYFNNRRLFDTPQAVARVFHSHSDAMRIIISAQRSRES